MVRKMVNDGQYSPKKVSWLPPGRRLGNWFDSEWLRPTFLLQGTYGGLLMVSMVAIRDFAESRNGIDVDGTGFQKVRDVSRTNF